MKAKLIRPVLGLGLACALAILPGAGPAADLQYRGMPLASERWSADQRERAADYLLERLRDAGVPAELQKYRAANTHWFLDIVLPPMHGQNVVATLPATVGSDRTIIIGAHYDSKYKSPGVDDNASGVLAVISLAERMGKVPGRNATLVFLFFDQEEEGAAGSKAFARDWVSSGRSLHSMHNIDMVGYDGNGDLTFDIEVPDGELADVYEAAARKAGVRLSRTRFNSSDHLAFRDRGYSAVCLGENFSGGDINPQYHRAGDLALDSDYLEHAIAMMEIVVARLISS